MQAKTDESQIEFLYREMYEAMIAKDTVTLNRVLSHDFVLTHMTGMHQSKQEYIRAIAGGILHLHVLRHIEKDYEYSSICRLYAFRRVPFNNSEANLKGYFMKFNLLD